jgi:hypothetical protein
MNNTSKYHKIVLIFLIIIFLFVFSYSQITQPNYPYIIVTPSSPIANKDSVKLQIILGTASNSCMAPTFSNEKAVIQQSPLAVYPPQYIVTVSYKTIPVPPDKICPMIYAPINYGPVFDLGILSCGTYNIIDSDKSVGSFNISCESSNSNTGSVTWKNATFTISTDKYIYYLTDSLLVSYSIINKSNSNITFGPFSGNCEYDLVISVKGGPEIYRESSDNSLCLRNQVYVTVPSLGTITKSYPKFGYPSGIETFVALLDSIELTLSNQLRGAQYDSSRASVDIKIKRYPPSYIATPHLQKDNLSIQVINFNKLVIFSQSKEKTNIYVFAPNGKILSESCFSKILDIGNNIIYINKYIKNKGIYLLQVKTKSFEKTFKIVIN